MIEVETKQQTATMDKLIENRDKSSKNPKMPLSRAWFASNESDEDIQMKKNFSHFSKVQHKNPIRIIFGR